EPDTGGAGAGQMSLRLRAGCHARRRFRSRRSGSVSARGGPHPARSSGGPAPAPDRSASRADETAAGARRHRIHRLISAGSDRGLARLRTYFTGRAIAEAAVAAIGAALVACAVIANQRWLDSHFLPGFFVSRQLYVFVESFIRVAIALIGIALALPAR